MELFSKDTSPMDVLMAIVPEIRRYLATTNGFTNVISINLEHSEINDPTIEGIIQQVLSDNERLTKLAEEVYQYLQAHK